VDRSGLDNVLLRRKKLNQFKLPGPAIQSLCLVGMTANLLLALLRNRIGKTFIM
jgi:hypothetical protein